LQGFIIMRIALSVAAFAVIASLSPTLAEDGQWTQVTNLPKGLNVAPGVVLSVLGIEPGSSLDEVRAIAEGLLAEHVAGPERTPEQKFMDNYSGNTSPPIQEYNSGVMLTTPGGDQIKLGYVGRIDVNRDLVAGGAIADDMRIDLSAPSSGSQVVGIQRRLIYSIEDKQPRIGPLLDELKAKLGEPMVIDGGASHLYRWQFDGGVAVHRANFNKDDCWPYIGDVTQQNEIRQVNTRSGGDCDVVFDAMIVTGISDDHAGSITFTLSDNERGKANLITDFAFFSTYVERYQQSVGGEGPKL
jgi:hypothetical protein